MHDKTVRRRRAVLVLLVVLSLILLTAYFGEAPSGRLHSVQRGFLTVVSPIQDGANKALKPVRDLFGWFGDTLHAKSQRDRTAQAGRQTAPRSGRRAARKSRPTASCWRMYHLDNQLSVADYRPVTATVVGKSPNIWYSTVTIDKGDVGGRAASNDPVINGEGLVGKVTQAASDGAQVEPHHRQLDGRLGARSARATATGIVQPKVGEPNDLLLQYLPANTPANGANTWSPRAPSRAPTTRCTRRASRSGR